jgi:hypothetical protein
MALFDGNEPNFGLPPDCCITCGRHAGHSTEACTMVAVQAEPIDPPTVDIALPSRTPDSVRVVPALTPGSRTWLFLPEGG